MILFVISCEHFIIYVSFMCGFRKFCQMGSNFDSVFFLGGGGGRSKYQDKRTIIGLPAKRHLNGVSLAADNCLSWNAGLVALFD